MRPAATAVFEEFGAHSEHFCLSRQLPTQRGTDRGPAPHSGPPLLRFHFCRPKAEGGVTRPPNREGEKENRNSTQRRERGITQEPSPAARPLETIFKHEELLSLDPSGTLPPPTFDAFSLHSNVSLIKKKRATDICYKKCISFTETEHFNSPTPFSDCFNFRRF